MARPGPHHNRCLQQDNSSDEHRGDDSVTPTYGVRRLRDALSVTPGWRESICTGEGGGRTRELGAS